jgi:segregation and condensation protein B
LPTGSADDNPALDLGIESFQQPPEDEGLSLDSISQAFAAMLADGDDPYLTPSDDAEDQLLAQAQAAISAGRPADEGSLAANDGGEISPRSILEAMLFVGRPDNQPLTSEQVASLMRGVRRAEIDELVVDLNRQYRAESRPYTIVADGAGYRLSLAESFAFVRERLYGRPRSARLSPAAVEVLAIVAYNEPVTAEQVSQMRGTASGPVLAQLVRRELLQVERRSERPHAAFYVTAPRFLQLFHLTSLEDLPRSREIE